MSMLTFVRDPRVATPSKLRHSWLENQVLLLLHPSSPQQVTREQALRMLDSWRADMGQLAQYSQSFPGLTDPGAFLEAFLLSRGLPRIQDELDQLRDRFRRSYRSRHGMTPSECREALLDLTAKLRKALEDLRTRVEQQTPGARLSLPSIDASESAFNAATRLHRLLATASPGVYLP
jgi:hypothetical protein